MELFDTIAFLEDRNIEYSTEGKNTTQGWVNISCVFCGDASNHLGINLTTQLFSCWACGLKGSIVKIIKKIDQCSWAKAYYIAHNEFQNYGLLTTPPKEKITNKPEKLIIPPEINNTFLPFHFKFLEKRGFNAQRIIKKYKLLSGNIIGDFKFRLIIPYFLDGQIVTFSSRDVSGKSKIPYKHLSDKKSILSPKTTWYNLDSVKGDSVVIVEGCLDVWRIGKNTISCSGIKFTQEQIKMLVDFGIKKVHIFFDGEPEAIKQAKKLASACSVWKIKAEVHELAEGIDPCDLNKEEVKEIRKLVK